MGSLDVDSLFANTHTIYSQQNVIEGINKEDFLNLLSLATEEFYFIFSKVLDKQKDGVAMGFP